MPRKKETYTARLIGAPSAEATSRNQPETIVSGLGPLIDRFANAETAAEMAYAVLRRAILDNVLAPGGRLRADELARQLGVSKTPVREALRKLQAEDLVAVSSGNALTVKVLSEEQLLETYATREALEGMAARLAAEGAGQIDLTNLRAVLKDLEGAYAQSDLTEIRRFSGEFQLAVFRAAHNEMIYGLLKALRDKIRIHGMTTMSVPGRDKEVIRFCRELLKSIENRDPDGAERIARANRRRTLDLRLRMIRSGSSPPT